MSRRVVITGLGGLTPIGSGVEAFFQSLQAGRSGIGWLTRFDRRPFRAQCAGEIPDYRPEDYFPSHKLKRLDRYAQFSLIAAGQALTDAGLRLDPATPRDDVGVSFGTALGGIAGAEAQHENFLAKGPAGIPPALALQVFGGSAHSNIALTYGLRGYATTNSNSCASGTVSVGEAFRALRAGHATTMIAGAAEAPLAPLTFGAFDAIKSMSPENQDPANACRPFDRKRNGFVMAEGAAALVLEEWESARQRGARVYAEVLGYALNNDAYHMTSSLPEGEAAIRAMEQALAEAKLRPEQITYVNAHASSTPMNDAHEAKAIQKVFAPHAPLVGGTKGYYGHPLGAAGAIEAMIGALAIARDFVPPTLHCREPDVPPGFNLIYGSPRHQPVDYVLSNSFGFGGINACLVLGKMA